MPLHKKLSWRASRAIKGRKNFLIISILFVVIVSGFFSFWGIFIAFCTAGEKGNAEQVANNLEIAWNLGTICFLILVADGILLICYNRLIKNLEEKKEDDSLRIRVSPFDFVGIDLSTLKISKPKNTCPPHYNVIPSEDGTCGEPRKSG